MIYLVMLLLAMVFGGTFVIYHCGMCIVNQRRTTEIHMAYMRSTKDLLERLVEDGELAPCWREACDLQQSGLLMILDEPDLDLGDG